MLQNKLTLPIITEHNRLSMMIAGYILFCILYLGSPYVALQSPISVPKTLLDGHIPLVRLMVWFYLSQFVFLFCAIWYAGDNITRSIAFYSTLLVIFVATLIFIGFPTILPRYPIEGDKATALLWQWLYRMDVQGNCLPSLHAALAAIASYPLYKRGGILKIVAPVWALIIILAALMTKQHVILDILAGLVLALLCHIFVVRYFQVNEYDKS